MYFSGSKTSWDSLPNEMRARIVRMLDTPSCLALKLCTHNDAKLVRKFAKNDISLGFFYFQQSDEHDEKFAIILKDEPSKVICLQWWITFVSETSAVVEFTDRHGRLNKLMRETTLSAAISQIIRHIDANPTYRIKALYLDLHRFDEFLELGSNCFQHLERLYVNTATRYGAFRKLVSQLKPKYENIVTRDASVVRMLRYWKIENICSKYPRGARALRAYHKTFVFNFNRGQRIDSFEKAVQYVRQYLSVIVPFSRLMRNEEMRRRIESRSTITPILYFLNIFADHYRLAAPVTYLERADAHYNDNISYMNGGLTNGFLCGDSDGLVPIVYLVRLFSDEPAVQMVSEEYHECFKLALEQCGKVNEYEKFIRKIDTLLDLPA